ncbi:MAG: Ig-like domain-containing protein [Hornefia sp.]|nr:Ig-like domain-containing protein [Hornefia sp.]
MKDLRKIKNVVFLSLLAMVLCTNLSYGETKAEITNLKAIQQGKEKLLLTWEVTSSKVKTYKIYVAKGMKGKFKLYKKDIKKRSITYHNKSKAIFKFKVVPYIKKKAGKTSNVVYATTRRKDTSKITINIPDTIYILDKHKLSATQNSNWSKKIEWKIYDEMYLKEENGYVIPQKIGMVRIKAKALNGFETYKDIKILGRYPSVVTIQQADMKKYEKDSFYLSATTDEVKFKDIVWKSSDAGKVKIDNTGKVTVLKPGKVRITAMGTGSNIYGEIAKSSIVITAYPLYPTKVKTSFKKTRMYTHKCKTIKVKTDISKYKKIRFKSSNTKIATISKKGKIYTKRAGKCTIYVISYDKYKNDIKKKIRITVLPKSEKAVLWAIKIAKNNKFGYSMGINSIGHNRFDWFVNHKNSKDYDCASYVGAAIYHGMGQKTFKFTGACPDLYSKLKRNSWKNLGKISKKKIKRGDVVINPNRHVEICIGKVHGRLMFAGAHLDYDGKTGDSSGNEISIGSAKTLLSHYTNVFRYYK